MDGVASCMWMAPAFLIYPLEASATTLLKGPVITPPLQSSTPRHTRSKDPNMAEKGAQLCLLVDFALWAWRVPLDGDMYEG